MSRFILFIVFSLCVSVVLAQAEWPTTTEELPHVCGQTTTPDQIAYLKASNPNLNLSFRPSMDTIKVPILFHRIADENGNGAVTLAQVSAALVSLNDLYAEGRIVFEECEAPRLIADSTYYDYQYSEEFALRQAHEVTGVLNVFIPNRASSSSGGQVCGYAYLPPTRRDMTIVKASCFTNGTTLPHEVGHFLGLYHTHGTSNCGSLTDELVDGSNCDTRGDDVCDTPADPNLLGVDCDRYVVNSSCVYTGTETDANGDSFAPDTRNIMSYSRKACREGFSMGQLDRVRYYLGTSRSYLACPVNICETTIPTPVVTDQTMTSISIAFDDNGQDRTEIQYSVNGGQQQGLSTPDLTASLGGFYPCDSVIIRARNVCADGFGDWSAYVSTATNGCGLPYCAQPNSGSEVLIEELGLNGAMLPSMQTPENYGIHAGITRLMIDPMAPVLSINATFDGNGNPAHFQVWIDFDDNGSFEASELIVQERVLSQAYTFDYTVDASVVRDIPLRARFNVSQEYYVDPCEIELGETEDVDLVFESDFDMVQWIADSINLDAPIQTVELPFSASVNWSVVGLPAWLTAPSWNGTRHDSIFILDVKRNESCESRMHTLVIAGPNGLRDELVVKQHPAPLGITVNSPDTITASAASGIFQLESSSEHLYQVESIDIWVNLSESNLIDTNIHLFSYSRNTIDEDRYTNLIFEGCGAKDSVVVYQPAARTSWENAADIYLQAVGDTVSIEVLSNVQWEALSSKAWLDAVDSTGFRDGVVTFVYTGNATSEEVAEIRLTPYFGLFDGPMDVRVIAPFVSNTSQPILSEKLILANPIADRLVASTVPGGAQGSSPESGASAKTYQWSVYSALGQRMYTGFGESLNVDASMWPSGTYLVKIEDKTGAIKTQRVVKF